MAALQDIYKGDYSKRKVQHFEDGGSPYASYAGTGSYAPQNSGAPTKADISADTSGAADPANLSAAGVPVTASGAPIEGGAGSNTSGSLSKILSSLGLGGGNTSNTAALGALTGLLSAYGHYAQSKAGSTLPNMPAMGALPTLPGSTSTGYGPAGGYNYKNYQGANASTPGTGFAPKTASPAAPAASYFTYGQGPEAQYFQQVKPNGGQLTPIPGNKNGGHIKMAGGGPVPHFDFGGIVGGQQSVLGGSAMAQPGMTPQTPRPMSGIGTPPSPQIPQAPQTPQMVRPSPGMPPSPGLQPSPVAGPRPQLPPQAPRPQAPQAPQPSTMMQRMQMARPQMGRQMFADGGTTNTPTQAPGQIPMIPPQQMAQSQSIQTQNPHTLGNVYRRGVGTSAQLPTGIHPVIQAHATGGQADGQGALSSVGQSRHVTGPGDGTSDSIPARLASGEYVIDAQGVSMLGNGDNAAGARKLDEFRKNLRQHKGGALAKGQMAPDAKPIHKYMGGN
jgi:hypothetical protein